MKQIAASLHWVNTWTAVAVLALAGWLIDSLLWYLETHALTLAGFGTFLLHSWYALPLLAAIFIILRLRPSSELLSLIVYDERGAAIHRQGDCRLETSVLQPMLVSFNSTAKQQGFHHLELSTGAVIYFLRQGGLTLVACFSGPPPQSQLKAGLRLLNAQGMPSEDLLRDLPLDVAVLTVPLLSDPVMRDLLVQLGSRRQTTMTAADWASQIGCGELEAADGLEKLEELGLVHGRTVLDMTFYRLTEDEERLRRLDHFITWRNGWLNRADRVVQLVGPANQPTIQGGRRPANGSINSSS